MYEERKLVPANPFVTIDRAGRRAADADRDATRGAAANTDLHLGICGEHGGDPARSCSATRSGWTTCSCSPFRVETARLAAGQAAVGAFASATA